MADITTTTSNTGTAAATQNPQSIGQTSLSNPTNKTIQGTNSNSILSNSSSGTSIQLENTQPSIVNINPSEANSVVSTSTTKAVHINYFGISLVSILVLVAVITFLNINKNFKNTTKNY